MDEQMGQKIETLCQILLRQCQARTGPILLKRLSAGNKTRGPEGPEALN